MADVFEVFRNKCFETDRYFSFFISPELSWEAIWKKGIEAIWWKKELEEEYVIQYTDMQKQIINIWKTDKIKESSYVVYVNEM